MRAWGTVWLALSLVLWPTPASADSTQDCALQQDWDRAIIACTTVIESGRRTGADLAWAYNNRCYAHNELGEHQRAIHDCDEALRLDPGLAGVYHNRGIAYTRLGQHQRAIQDYDQALRLDPGLTVAYNNRCYAHNKLGQHRRAIQDCDEAIRLDPGNAGAYVNRAIAYCAVGEVGRSVSDRLRTLDLGAVSPTQAQQLLAGAGHYAGAIDGSFGPSSYDALERWTEAGCPP